MRYHSILLLFLMTSCVEDKLSVGTLFGPSFEQYPMRVGMVHSERHDTTFFNVDSAFSMPMPTWGKEDHLVFFWNGQVQRTPNGDFRLTRWNHIWAHLEFSESADSLRVHWWLSSDWEKKINGVHSFAKYTK